MSMVGFLANSKAFEVQANNQVAALLAQFDSGYVMDVIQDTLSQLFTSFDTIPRPNIVQSFETTFKELYNTYPNDLDNINQCRMDTYQTIIDYICKKFDIRFIQSDNVDMHTLAFFMYDFFVARLNIYMVQFYVRHLLNEKESIAKMINIEELKKTKEPNFIYNLMAFGNDELAAIASNIPYVLRQLATSSQVLDHQIYMYTYGTQPEIVQMLEECISPTISIYSRYNSLLFNDALYGPIITHIRVQFQQAAGNDVSPMVASNPN